MTEEIWITLEQFQIDYVDKIAERRIEIAMKRDANTETRTWEQCYIDARDGHRAEAAARVFFGRTIPWSIQHLIVDGKFEARPDFSNFIDVKGRTKTHHQLRIDERYYEARHAYMLVCGASHPRYRIIGWCWGHEAATGERWLERRKGSPAWWVKENDPIMKSPHELRTLALERESVRA